MEIVFHLNIYQDDAGLSPMVEVAVYDSLDPVVRVLDPGLQRELRMPETGIELDEMPCNLKVIGLLEYAESSVSTVVTDYLKDVVDSVQTDGILKQKLRTLGYLGEAAWSTEVSRTLGEAKKVTYNSYQYKFIPLSSGSYLVRLDDADGSFRTVCKRMLELLEALQEHRGELKGIDLSDISREDLKNIRVAVPDGIYEKLSNPEYAGTVSLEADLDEDYNLPDSIASMIKNGRIVSNESGAGQGWLYNYISSSMRASASSALFGGAISAGVKVYDKYQAEGRLPGSYSEDEMRDMVVDVAHDAARHAVTGFAVHNMRYQNVPTLAAATVAGVGNHLYDRYREGMLNWGNVPSAVLESGAESLIAGVTGTAASLIVSSVPGVNSLPAIQTVGALTGSLVGHYIYQYSVDRGVHKKLYSSAQQSWSGKLGRAAEVEIKAGEEI